MQHTLTMGSRLSREEIRVRLRAYRPAESPPWPETLWPRLKPAAVLVPLLPRPDDWHVLLTRRTTTVAAHKGQVALPGGAQEPGDRDAVATALREAFEELGIPPSIVEPIATLPPEPVISGYRVTPVVAFIPPDVPLRPSRAEIARVFTVPLGWLADARHVREERREWEGVVYPVYIYEPYLGEVIWGLTARILRHLVRAVYQAGT